MTKRIVLIAERRQNEIDPVAFALMATAAQLQAGDHADIRLIITGDSVQPAAERLAADCSCPVLALELGGTVDYLDERSAAALLNEFESDRPDYICIGHTMRGVSLAGTLAAGLDGACITGVEDIIAADDGLYFRRSTYGGKFVATVASESPTTILTILPGACQPPETTHATGHPIEIKTVGNTKNRIRLLGCKAAVAGAADLADARVLIAAGQGIGEPENLDLIRQLAACFPNAAVAGTRIVCDLGWLNYNRQVGVSGNSVAPELYFACGISGAVQHLMGMRGSKYVVALNTDPNAAIFREADVCIVEDLKAFIPAFISALDPSD